jgi:hypothetical protein
MMFLLWTIRGKLARDEAPCNQDASWLLEQIRKAKRLTKAETRQLAALIYHIERGRDPHIEDSRLLVDMLSARLEPKKDRASRRKREKLRHEAEKNNQLSMLTPRDA